MSHITQYYVAQAQTGAGMPYFAGASTQRGYGLGSFLGGLFRSVVLPSLSRGARTVGQEALRAGSHILADVASGAQPFKSSLKRHATEAGENLVSRISSDMRGNGIKRAKPTRRVHSGRVVRRQRISPKYSDILSRK